MSPINPTIIEGKILGSCPACKGSYIGVFSHASEDIHLQCTECQHSTNYKYKWPDESPIVTLRFRSSGQIVGKVKYKKRRKKEKGVQMELEDWQQVGPDWSNDFELIKNGRPIP